MHFRFQFSRKRNWEKKEKEEVNSKITNNNFITFFSRFEIMLMVCRKKCVAHFNFRSYRKTKFIYVRRYNSKINANVFNYCLYRRRRWRFDIFFLLFCLRANVWITQNKINNRKQAIKSNQTTKWFSFTKKRNGKYMGNWK